MEWYLLARLSDAEWEFRLAHLPETALYGNQSRGWEILDQWQNRPSGPICAQAKGAWEHAYRVTVQKLKNLRAQHDLA
jgi:hypothetical protein